ncbi:hypothetical protein NPIL_453761 [Nephila pilipes]|uniref:Uncharacterized protein n=1 Tax=Nephila pilipes TaxID=299642 RepID=A0A8X6NEF7_NEPPI|nr:hypothetical protein NPIL_453761 [Nephila pilipes]
MVGYLLVPPGVGSGSGTYQGPRKMVDSNHVSSNFISVSKTRGHFCRVGAGWLRLFLSVCTIESINTGFYFFLISVHLQFQSPAHHRTLHGVLDDEGK